MHIDFLAIWSFIVGTLWGYFRRQAIGAIDWLVIDYLSIYIRRIINYFVSRVKK